MAYCSAFAPAFRAGQSSLSSNVRIVPTVTSQLRSFTRPSAPFGSSRDRSKSNDEMATFTSSKSPTQSTNEGQKLPSVEEDNERVRKLLLERDGGPASVATREGKWESEMGRETSRQMHRVLDQTRVARPGQSSAMGEGESKGFSWRNR